MLSVRTRPGCRSYRANSAAATEPNLLTCAEKLQYEGSLRREEMNAAIMMLAGEGIAIKEIVRRSGHSRKLVRQVMLGERTVIFRIRQSSLEAHLPMLDELWKAGCRNGAELWRRLTARRQTGWVYLTAKGFRGSMRVVGEWTTRRRRAERSSEQQLCKVPSDRTIARLMTTARDHLGKSDTVTIAAIEAGVPMLVEARCPIDRFRAMILANGITRNRAAVRAAITEPWSNRQTEGQITKLKLDKHQMFGRGKFDLLQARLIGAA